MSMVLAVWQLACFFSFFFTGNENAKYESRENGKEQLESGVCSWNDNGENPKNISKKKKPTLSTTRTTAPAFELGIAVVVS